MATAGGKNNSAIGVDESAWAANLLRKRAVNWLGIPLLAVALALYTGALDHSLPYPDYAALRIIGVAALAFNAFLFASGSRKSMLFASIFLASSVAAVVQLFGRFARSGWRPWDLLATGVLSIGLFLLVLTTIFELLGWRLLNADRRRRRLHESASNLVFKTNIESFEKMYAKLAESDGAPRTLKICEAIELASMKYQRQSEASQQEVVTWYESNRSVRDDEARDAIQDLALARGQREFLKYRIRLELERAGEGNSLEHLAKQADEDSFLALVRMAEKNKGDRLSVEEERNLRNAFGKLATAEAQVEALQAELLDAP